MKKKAKVISLISTKGGCGKTCILNALANYLARKNKHILLIDLNSQGDLTSDFSMGTNKETLQKSNIFRAFAHDSKNPQSPFKKDFKPTKCYKNIDIMASSKKLRTVNDLMHTKQPAMADYTLSHIFSKKFGLDLRNKYDYIMIDTHNDTETPVRNAMVESDYLLCPVTPSKYGINSVQDTIDEYKYLQQQLLDPVTRQSFINAKLFFIGNMVKFNTKNSHLFLKAIKNNNNFIACFHYRELFNKASASNLDIFSMAYDETSTKHNYRDEETLNQEIIPQLNKIYKAIK